VEYFGKRVLPLVRELELKQQANAAVKVPQKIIPLYIGAFVPCGLPTERGGRTRTNPRSRRNPDCARMTARALSSNQFCQTLSACQSATNCQPGWVVRTSMYAREMSRDPSGIL
jgi:hypothetical protein